MTDDKLLLYIPDTFDLVSTTLVPNNTWILGKSIILLIMKTRT